MKCIWSTQLSVLMHEGPRHPSVYQSANGFFYLSTFLCFGDSALVTKWNHSLKDWQEPSSPHLPGTLATRCCNWLLFHFQLWGHWAENAEKLIRGLWLSRLSLELGSRNQDLPETWSKFVIGHLTLYCHLIEIFFGRQIFETDDWRLIQGFFFLPPMCR